MEELTVHLLDITYKIEGGKAVVYFFGILPDGKRICVRDAGFSPYFYAMGGAEEHIVGLKLEEGRITHTETTERKLHGKPLPICKIFTDLPRTVPAAARAVRQLGSQVFENDVLFTRRYVLDKGIFPHTATKVVGDWVASDMAVPLFDAVTVAKESDRTRGIPRILALDIETYAPSNRIEMEKNPILMIAVTGDNFRRVVAWKNFPTDNKDIEFVAGEKELLLRLKTIMDEYQPHIVCGYNSDRFDFPYIKKRADIHGVMLPLGLDYSPILVPQGDDAVRITGIPHIDVYKFIKKIMGRSMQTPVFSLDAVAGELLHQHKHDVNLNEMSTVWDTTPEKLEPYALYNLQDAILTYELCRLLWQDIEEFTILIGLPAETVTRLSYSQLVEQYIFRQARQHRELAPNKPEEKELEVRSRMRIKGGYVYEPTPGLYQKIVVLDFRSLYPSIIISHNISPSSLRCACCHDSENSIAINGQQYWFCTKQRGFLSIILEDIVTKRADVKKRAKAAEGDEKRLLSARSEALKLLSNSFYGYLGFAAARWYSLESAEATTAFGRQYIQSVIKQAEENGFSILYTDTDSIFLQLGQKGKNDAQDFQQRINDALPGMMELEWENFYPAGIFVALKGTGGGAKKRYALVDEKGQMKIRGFEMVRRNVAPIAREVQQNVLSILLKEGNAKKACAYIRDTIKAVSGRKIEKEKMIIFTQLQKDIGSYSSISPHVAAANRMKQQGMPVGSGSFIYYIVCGGPGKLRDKVRLPDESSDYDADYYIQHQILPSIERIMEVFGYTAEDLLRDEKQSALSGFW
ncbi:ribonuclease H-like domain-containing protein [Candidatus Woesearchaeota archaeon]|nr:ribonuclease H-like domain-containing protein [Candidatus Woesearchaeota archaeon]